MGFLAPAMPWIIKGGAALGSMIMSKHSQKAAMKRTGEENAQLTGAEGAANSMQQGGTNMIQSGQQGVQQGQDNMSSAGGYWSKLMGGNRAQMAQATAGSRASITDIYRGAERGLERSNVRGAQRDVASADLNRDRAGKIAGLTTGVQPGAAAQLGDLGNSQAATGNQTASTGANMQGNAGTLFSNLLGQSTANRQYGRAEGEKTGKGVGSFLFDMLSGVGGKKGFNFTDKVGSVGDIPGMFKSSAF